MQIQEKSFPLPLYKIIAKFIVSRCVLAKLRMGFSVPSITWVGVNANHNATHLPSLDHKNKIVKDPKLLKNNDGNHDDEWDFCWGQEADIALLLQETRIGKVIKSFEEN